MGDRCHIYLTCRRIDAHLFNHDFSFAHDGDPEGDEDETTPLAHLECEEGYASPDDYFKLGVPFIGHHGKGWEYGPAVFAGDATGWYERDVLESGDHFIEFDDTQPDHVCPKDRADLLEYLAFERKVWAQLNATPEPPAQLPKFAAENI